MTFCWVPMDGAGISTLDKSTGAASITFFDLAYCSSDHHGVLVAALHEEPLGNIENLLDRLLRVLIACHGHLRPYYHEKYHERRAGREGLAPKEPNGRYGFVRNAPHHGW